MCGPHLTRNVLSKTSCTHKNVFNMCSFKLSWFNPQIIGLSLVQPLSRSIRFSPAGSKYLAREILKIKPQ